VRIVEPKVILLGETQANSDGLKEFLDEMGVPNWRTDCPSDAEGLLELYGRGCYRAFAPGLNPNVTKVREGNKAYLSNIIKQEHGSVFEHASANFMFMHVSRVFTHELVRHRVGVGISQESLRFVRLDDLDFWIPPDIAENPEALAVFEEAIAAGERWQKQLAAIFKLDDTEVSFEYKKQVTSTMRRIAPEGLATMIGWSANFRILRHAISLRTHPAAEREIRLVFAKVADIAKQRWPNAFGDFTATLVDGINWYQSPHPKI
jgi:thymidylate synthase (FAD)